MCRCTMVCHDTWFFSMHTLFHKVVTALSHFASAIMPCRHVYEKHEHTMPFILSHES